MALAFETGGYGFAPALVPVDQSALQGLKPLTFTSGGQSPVQFRPLAGWSVPSAHPEQVGLGIASGIGAIAQGLTAAYISKREKDAAAIEKQHQEERENTLLADKYAHEEKIESQKLAEIEAYHKEQADLRQQIIDRGGDKHPTAPSIRGGVAPQKEKLQKTDTQQETTSVQEQPISSDPNGLIPSDEFYDKQKNTYGEPPPAPTPVIRKNGAVEPPFSEAPYSDKPFGANTIQYNPFNINPDTQYLTTSAATPNVAMNPATANPNFPYGLQAIDPRQVVSAAQQFGQQASPVQQQVQALLSSIPPVQAPVQQTAPAPAASQQPSVIPEFERAIGEKKWMPEQDALDLRDYAASKGINAQVEQDEHNPDNFRVIWPSIAEQATESSRLSRQKELADLGQERLQLRELNTAVNQYNAAQTDFERNPLAKDVEEKMRPAVQRFYGDYIPLVKMGDFSHSGPVAQNLADQYVRFATGGVPTMAQYDALTSNRPLWEKIKTQAAKATGIGDTPLLSKEDFKQMAETMGKALNIGHEQLNTQIADNRDYVSKMKSLKVDEHNMPHKYPVLKFEDDVKSEMDQTQKEMESLWDKKTNQPKDSAKYAEASARHADLSKQLELAKTGIPANFDDFRHYGEKINGRYYPSGWRGKIISDIAPQYFPPYDHYNAGQ
jgi:hypothetical protein